MSRAHSIAQPHLLIHMVPIMSLQQQGPRLVHTAGGNLRPQDGVSAEAIFSCHPCLVESRQKSDCVRILQADTPYRSLLHRRSHHDLNRATSLSAHAYQQLADAMYENVSKIRLSSHHLSPLEPEQLKEALLAARVVRHCLLPCQCQFPLSHESCLSHV